MGLAHKLNTTETYGLIFQRLQVCWRWFQSVSTLTIDLNSEFDDDYDGSNYDNSIFVLCVEIIPITFFDAIEITDFINL